MMPNQSPSLACTLKHPAAAAAAAWMASKAGLIAELLVWAAAASVLSSITRIVPVRKNRKKISLHFTLKKNIGTGQTKKRYLAKFAELLASVCPWRIFSTKFLGAGKSAWKRSKHCEYCTMHFYEGSSLC